jgi:hypothetical protein
VFDSLAGAAEARVTVERNGAKQDLVLNLAEIAPEAERLATAPPPEDPSMQPAGASPPGPPPGVESGDPPPPPPGPEGESAR